MSDQNQVDPNKVQVSPKPWFVLSRASMATGLAGLAATFIIGAAQHYNVPLLYYIGFITQSQDPAVDATFLATIISTAVSNYTPPSVLDVIRRINGGVVAMAAQDSRSPLQAAAAGDKVIVPIVPPGNPPVVAEQKTDSAAK